MCSNLSIRGEKSGGFLKKVVDGLELNMNNHSSNDWKRFIGAYH